GYPPTAPAAGETSVPNSRGFHHKPPATAEPTAADAGGTSLPGVTPPPARRWRVQRKCARSIGLPAPRPAEPVQPARGFRFDLPVPQPTLVEAGEKDCSTRPLRLTQLADARKWLLRPGFRRAVARTGP